MKDGENFKMNTKIMNSLNGLEGLKYYDELKLKISDYCKDQHHRDGRGLKSVETEKLLKLLKHLKSALKYRHEHSDPQIRRQARKLLTSIRSEPLDRLFLTSSEFSGALKKAGTRKRLLSKQQNARQIPISGNRTLRELSTWPCLLSVSKTLQLCIGTDQMMTAHYREQLKDGSSQFWGLYDTDSKPKILIEIDADSGQICDAKAKNNNLPKWTFKTAREILRNLEVTGDECEAFQRVGAFSNFLESGRPKRPGIETPIGTIQVWSYPGEFILALRKPDAKARIWTKYIIAKNQRFVCQSWHHNSIDTDILAPLFIKSLQLCRAVEASFRK